MVYIYTYIHVHVYELNIYRLLSKWITSYKRINNDNVGWQ
jgi:hypothetical protein